MKTIIAGSRTVTRYSDVLEAVATATLFGISPTLVLSGMARGVDQLGERWAEEHAVPVQHFPANWHRYPKTAGMIRNGQMARQAEALIAIWDGESPGTKHMVKLMRELGRPVWVHEVSVRRA